MLFKRAAISNVKYQHFIYGVKYNTTTAGLIVNETDKC